MARVKVDIQTLLPILERLAELGVSKIWMETEKESIFIAFKTSRGRSYRIIQKLPWYPEITVHYDGDKAYIAIRLQVKK